MVKRGRVLMSMLLARLFRLAKVNDFNLSRSGILIPASLASAKSEPRQMYVSTDWKKLVR